MEPLEVYACYNTDKGVRLSSSSGAVFSSLAEYVLEQQGVVYGVAMSTDCYSAEFISVTSKEQNCVDQSICRRRLAIHISRSKRI